MFACTFINTVKLAQKSLRGRQVHSLVTKAVVASDAAKNLTSDSRKYHAIARISSSSSEALLPQNECFRGMPIQQVRAASSFATSSSPDLKAFPQYTVFGETCMLTVKVMMPGFRVLKSNTLVVDGNKRGRIVFEWTPRDAEGTNVF